MTAKCGVYVDAGYLLGSAATRATGSSLRNGVTVDYPELLGTLIREAETLSGLRVLRVNWYDAANDGVPDDVQKSIGQLPRVKLRLGRFGFDGQQKGVDLRIGLDMVAHARNRAVETILLVSGDDDLTEAVEEAQLHGVEVIVVAIPNADGKPHGVSHFLRRAADDLHLLDPVAVDTVVRSRPPTVTTLPRPTAPDPDAPSPARVAKAMRQTPAEILATNGAAAPEPVAEPEPQRPDEEIERIIDEVARRALTSFLATGAAEARAVLAQQAPSIPRELDRALLLDLSDALGIYTLGDQYRTRLRQHFWKVYEADGEQS